MCTVDQGSTVVKLFNAIQQSQTNASTIAEDNKAARGTGKPTLPAPILDTKLRRNVKGKDTSSIRGKSGTVFSHLFFTVAHRSSAAVEKEDFFQMIRSGGIVSKV